MRAGGDDRQADLFAWRIVSEIQAKRDGLTRRIANLKPNSHRRVELIERLKQLTVEQLEKETRR